MANLNNNFFKGNNNLKGNNRLNSNNNKNKSNSSVLKILIIAVANLSKPFAKLSFPEKIITLSFFGNLVILLILGYIVLKLL